MVEQPVLIGAIVEALRSELERHWPEFQQRPSGFKIEIHVAPHAGGAQIHWPPPPPTKIR